MKRKPFQVDDKLRKAAAKAAKAFKVEQVHVRSVFSLNCLKCNADLGEHYNEAGALAERLRIIELLETEYEKAQDVNFKAGIAHAINLIKI